MRYGQAAKLFVAVREPAPPSATLSVPGRWWCYTQLGADGQPAPFVAAFAGSPGALERLEVSAGPGRWLTELAQLRPDLDLDPERAFVSTWQDDPWARGAYSAESATSAIDTETPHAFRRAAVVRRRAHCGPVARPDGGRRCAAACAPRNNSCSRRSDEIRPAGRSNLPMSVTAKQTSPAVELEVGGPDRADLEPGPGLLLGSRGDQARPREVLHERGGRDRPRPARAAVHAASLPGRGRRPEGAPEAPAQGRSRLDRDRGDLLSRASAGRPTSCA